MKEGEKDAVSGGKPRAGVPSACVAIVVAVAVWGARAVWLEVTAGVRGSATALMERLDALTDPERVEDANMLAGWGAGTWGAGRGARGREGRA